MRIENGCAASMRGFDARHREAWENLFGADSEAGASEALVCGWLRESMDGVEPGAPPGQAGPDFCCASSGSRFYVEVTCVERDSAHKLTRLPPECDPETKGLLPVPHIVETVKSKSSAKAHQCSDLSAPCLLAITTFHHHVAVAFASEDTVEEALTSSTELSWQLDATLGDATESPAFTTNLRSSAALRLSKEGAVTAARQSISGWLLMGLAGPGGVLGVVHPAAARPFDRALLSNVRFCRLAPGYERGEFRVEWI